MRTISAWLILGLGCQSNEWTPTFGSSGGSQSGAEGGSGSTWLDEDSAWQQQDDDTQYAPSITEFRAAFEYYPTIGWVMESSIGYADQDGDVSGGFVHLTLEEEGGESFEQVIPIDGQMAYIEDSAVYFAIDQVDTNLSYALEVFIEDEAGNMSDVAQTVVQPT